MVRITSVLLGLMIVAAGFGPARSAEGAFAAQVEGEELGIVDDTTYRSPQFAVEVRWSGQWAVDERGLESNEEARLDRLSLQNESLSVTFQAIFVLAGNETAAEYRDRLREFRRELYPDLVLVEETEADETATLLYSFEEAGFTYLSYIEVRLLQDEPVFQVVELSVWEDTGEAAFADAQATIRVGDEAPFVEAAVFPGTRLEASPSPAALPVTAATPQIGATPGMAATPQVEATPQEPATPVIDGTPEPTATRTLALGRVDPTATLEQAATPEPTATRALELGRVDPTATSEPPATPRPTATAESTATSAPTATPRPPATPQPTLTPAPTATELPTDTPEPTATRALVLGRTDPTATAESTATSTPLGTPAPAATPSPPPTFEATPTTEPLASPEPTVLPSPNTVATPSPASTPADGTGSDPDQAALGLVSETEYESPQYGTTVQWPTTVAVEPPLVSDEESGDDVLRLQAEDGSFGVLVRTFPAAGSSVADGIAFYTEEYGERWDTFDVLLTGSDDDSGGTVVLLVNEAGIEVVQYIEIYATADDVLIEVILTTSPADLDLALPTAQEIEVNGEAAFQTFAEQEVLDAA